MTNNDTILEEIFHVVRNGLNSDSLEQEETEKPPLEQWSPLENLNISASETWKSQDDAFQFVCKKIKTRASEIEKRLNKVTSADILASVNVYGNSYEAKDRKSEKEFPVEPNSQKKVRFSFPEACRQEDKDDKVESLLLRIRQWLDPNNGTSCPPVGESRNKILSAYWEAVRVVGQGRASSEITVYNNPFDPRLQFDGLTDYVARKDSHQCGNKPGGNVLLWLDKVSDVVDECLQKYTKYLKSLRQESAILRTAIEKTEAVQSAAVLDPSTSLFHGCEFGPWHRGSGDVSVEEEAMVGKLRSIRKLWEECAETQGAQIPRRITARKPPPVPRRRMSVVSEVKASAWKPVTVLDRGDVTGSSKELSQERVLRKIKKDESPEIPPADVSEFSEHGRNGPQVWQRIAQEHIDEESLKHFRNATKERVGVKVMRPSVTTSKEPVSKTDSWAARVAQHIFTTAGTQVRAAGTIAKTVSSMSTVDKSESGTPAPNSQPSQPSPQHTRTLSAYYNALVSSSVCGTATASKSLYRPQNPTTTSGGVTNDRVMTATVSHHSTSVQTPVTTTVTAAVSQTPVRTATQPDPVSIAQKSSLNPLNSSPEWLRKLMAKTAAKSSTTTCSTTTIAQQTAKTPAAASREHRPPEKHPEDLQQKGSSQAQESRCRVPPGFEKTVLEGGNGNAPPAAHQQQHRTIPVPTAQAWQQQAPGAIYTGMNGETFIQPAATYHPAHPRVVHQFQRPIAQIGGNIAIWHPRPPQGSYILTDINGKTVGVGIPGWNRVDIQGRPHVIVHQSQIPHPTLRATVRPPPVFPSATATAPTNPESYGQQTFGGHLPQPHLQPGKGPEAAVGATNGFERGDPYSGFAGGVQPSQLNYQSRIVPQFTPSVQHCPPAMQTEYALFTSSHHKPPTFLKQQNQAANQNNNNNNNSNNRIVINSGLSNGAIDAPVVAHSLGTSVRPRQESRTYKTSRAVRSNLIQLA